MSGTVCCRSKGLKSERHWSTYAVWPPSLLTCWQRMKHNYLTFHPGLDIFKVMWMQYVPLNESLTLTLNPAANSFFTSPLSKHQWPLLFLSNRGQCDLSHSCQIEGGSPYCTFCSLELNSFNCAPPDPITSDILMSPHPREIDPFTFILSEEKNPL